MLAYAKWASWEPNRLCACQFPTVLLGLCGGWLLTRALVWVDVLPFSYEQGPSGM